MDLGLAGATAIVTGGASNIGHGIVLAFAREGAHVVIADVDEPQAERTAELARGFGVQAVVEAVDVTDPGQCEAMTQRTLARLGRIDVLVNNAGIGPRAHGPFRTYALDDARRAMDLNYWSAFHCIRAVVEPMIARGHGSIVNISSTAYLHGGAHLSVYASAKAAMVALAQCLALELGPHGIRVNTVAPGRVFPDGVEQVGESSSKYRPRKGNGVDDQAGAVAAAAAGRLGTPDDIARAVVWIASDAASFVTGKTLSVDGGVSRAGDQERKLAAVRSVWEHNA